MRLPRKKENANCQKVSITMEQNRPTPVTANDTKLARTLCSTEKTR